MKTTLKQLAAGTFIALLLLAGNVKTNGTEVIVSNLEINEPALELESWMTNEAVWNTNSFYTLDFAQETEAALELEKWMTSQEYWIFEKPVVEKELTLENWMIDSEIWK